MLIIYFKENLWGGLTWEADSTTWYLVSDLKTHDMEHYLLILS